MRERKRQILIGMALMAFVCAVAALFIPHPALGGASAAFGALVVLMSVV